MKRRTINKVFRILCWEDRTQQQTQCLCSPHFFARLCWWCFLSYVLPARTLSVMSFAMNANHFSEQRNVWCNEMTQIRCEAWMDHQKKAQLRAVLNGSQLRKPHILNYLNQWCLMKEGIFRSFKWPSRHGWDVRGTYLKFWRLEEREGGLFFQRVHCPGCFCQKTRINPFQ